MPTLKPGKLLPMADEVAAEGSPLMPGEEEKESAENETENTFLPCNGDEGGAQGEDKIPGVLLDGDGGDHVVCCTTRGALATVRYWCGVLKKSWFVDEAVLLLKLAFPLCIMFIFTQLPFFITLQFVGHFSGARELSATALGNVFINVTGYSVLIGIAMAADTLGPQSYGFKNYKRVGVILQRGLLILSVACVPIAIVWLNSESLLLLARQVPCVVSLTGKYTRIFVLAFPAMVVYIMLQKYLQAQSLVWVFAGIGLTANIVSVLSCAVLIVGAKLGTIGASLVIVLVYSLSPVLLIIYIKWRKLHLQTWGGWSFQSLTEWWQFLRLGIPGLLTLAFEWWSFEIGVLVSGSISELQLAITATILQLITLYYMVPLGMAQAINVRVGNELGAGNIISAKRSSFVAVGLQTMFATVISGITFAFRNFIGFIFTTDEKVVTGVGDALIGAIAVIFMDQVQGVISGVMRATGRQISLAMVNFFCYYILGLPLGIILALKLDMKAKGIWIGISVGDTVQTAILLILLLTTNWKKQSEKAMANASSASGFVAAEDTSSASMEEHSSDEELLSALGNDNQSADIQGHHISYDRPMKEEQMEEEEALGRNRVTLSSVDTERQDDYDSSGGGERQFGRTRLLYKSSSKLCQSRSSILLCRGLTLLVCVALLFVGVLLAVTIRHHPVGCDQEEGLTPANCSFLCYQSETNTMEVVITPTKVLSTPIDSNLQLPLPTSIQVAASPTIQVQWTTEGDRELMQSDCQCVIMPTPSLLLG